MDDTLSTRDQLARDLYVHNADMQPDVAFQAADAFMAERARRTPAETLAAVAFTARTPAVDTVCGDNRDYLAPVAAEEYSDAAVEAIANANNPPVAPVSVCGAGCRVQCEALGAFHYGPADGPLTGWHPRRVDCQNPICDEWGPIHHGTPKHRQHPRMPGECAASVTLCGAPVVLDPTMKGDDYRFEPSPAPPAAPAIVFSLAEHLRRQHEWSERTFGPGPRTAGVIDHIRKELGEIEAQPNDLEEWIDVVILALDGAWRSGASPEQIITALTAKQAKNELRTWPDWRTAEQGKAIEHIRKVTP